MVELAELIGGGLIVGMLLGTLGAGGSVLTVPMLVYFFGRSIPSATATSLIIVATTAAIGVVAHLRAGNVKLPTAAAMSGLASVGSLAGSFAGAHVGGKAFMLGFAALMVAGALLVWRTPEAKRAGTRECVLSPDVRSCGRLGVAGLGVGFLTGFFGVGGGFVIVPALLLVLAFDARAAIGTSLAVVAVAAAVGLVGHLGHASVDWSAAIPFAAGGSLGALGGQKLGKRLQGVALRRGFAASLVALALFVAGKTMAARPEGHAGAEAAAAR